MSTDSIEKLYKHFGVLADAKDKAEEHEEDYLQIVAAVKGSDKEKRLASQFIARFFKYFPKLANQAIEAQLDLCEDEDISIRKQAIKDLPRLCQDNKEHTKRIADILAQMLQATDQTELSVVHNSIMTLFKQEPKATLGGIFSQILAGDDLIREQCIKFLTAKVKSVGQDVLTKDAEDYLITECKKVLQDVTGEEFQMLMELLSTTKLGKTISGQKELVDIVAEQAELDKPFNPRDPDNENVDRLLQCVKYALPYFSTQLDSARFVSYFCDNVLPQLNNISGLEEGASDQQLELLNILAELSTHCGPLPDATEKVERVFNCLLEYMPQPPEGGNTEQSEPRLDFSHVESLIYTFHRLARQCPEILTKDTERLKDFRLRLHYFARNVQGYMKKLREALHGKTAEELKSEENKLKVVALKTTSNINTLIKDLFHTPPSFKSKISLSWKPATAFSNWAGPAVTSFLLGGIDLFAPSNSALSIMSDIFLQNGDSDQPAPRKGPDTGTLRHPAKDLIVGDGQVVGSKRHTPITFEGPASKQVKPSQQRELYQPPSGKYSNKVSSYAPQNRGRGRGRPRGSFGGGGGGGGSGGGGVNRGWRRNY